MCRSCIIGTSTGNTGTTEATRKGLEQRIDMYLVIVGPRGGGKTTVVQKTLMDRGNVVDVQLTSQVQMIQACLSSEKPFRFKDTIEAFDKGLHVVDKPVLVVEIDSNASAEGVRMQSHELMVLCTDAKLAHDILILRDVNATLKLNTDPGRQEFLWIDDFVVSPLGLLQPQGTPQDSRSRNSPSGTVPGTALWNVPGTEA